MALRGAHLQREIGSEGVDCGERHRRARMPLFCRSGGDSVLHASTVPSFASAPMVWLFVALACSGGGCATTRSASKDVVDLPLESAAGGPVTLASRRGRPLLLYFFATYDTASQLALSPLAEAARSRADSQVIGVALQPDAAPLLGLFGSSLDVDFPLAYDPDGVVLAGDTPLGRVPGVPYYVWLDGAGHITATHRGPLLGQELEAFLDEGQE